MSLSKYVCNQAWFTLFLTWWSVISLVFDFNQEDIRKKEQEIQVEEEKENDELKITNQS
jgi:hypothetical protein